VCAHRDARLVVELSFDIRSESLTWVVLGTDADGQAHWMQDGHDPLRTASPALMRALHDAVGGTFLELAAVGAPFND
jgi:hypothetical protein